MQTRSMSRAQTASQQASSQQRRQQIVTEESDDDDEEESESEDDAAGIAVAQIRFERNELIWWSYLSSLSNDLLQPFMIESPSSQSASYQKFVRELAINAPQSTPLYQKVIGGDHRNLTSGWCDKIVTSLRTRLQTLERYYGPRDDPFETAPRLRRIMETTQGLSRCMQVLQVSSTQKGKLAGLILDIWEFVKNSDYAIDTRHSRPSFVGGNPTARDRNLYRVIVEDPRGLTGLDKLPLLLESMDDRRRWIVLYSQLQAKFSIQGLTQAAVELANISASFRGST